MAKDAKDAADVTDVPEGLDVAVTMPGTIVGSHDLQGTDGTTRTDRPGEIVGTPVDTDRVIEGQTREGEKADFVREEVDRANREELPRLGGTPDDDWAETEEESESKRSERVAAQQAAATERTAAHQAAATERTAARQAKAAARTSGSKDSGISVKPGIDRGNG